MKALSKLSAKIDGLQEKAETLSASLSKKAGGSSVREFMERSKAVYEAYFQSEQEERMAQRKFLREVIKGLSHLTGARDVKSHLELSSHSWSGEGFTMAIGEVNVRVFFVRDKLDTLIKGLTVIVGSTVLSMGINYTAKDVVDAIIRHLQENGYSL